MRSTTWSYTLSRYPCLVEMARDIALGIDPHPSHKGTPLAGLTDKSCRSPHNDDQPCPKPINYLANGEDPNLSPLDVMGLAGRLFSGPASLPALNAIFGWNPCNFASLSIFASNKANRPSNWTNEQFRGFNLNSLSGLSILLGPWSDFCLWCWAQYPHLGEGAQPRLVLGKDNDTFANQSICPANDWGQDQVRDVEKIWGATDPSTRNLFGTLANHALKRPLGTAGGSPASKDELDTLQKFIAQERIFIYNVWPWFRCGKRSTGDDGIHSDFSRVPCLWHWVDSLISCLKPSKIAALGSWSYDTGLLAPDAWLRGRSAILRGFPPGNHGSSSPTIDVFRHPSARSPSGWSDRWPNPLNWGNAGDRWHGKPNHQAFVDFL